MSLLHRFARWLYAKTMPSVLAPVLFGMLPRPKATQGVATAVRSSRLPPTGIREIEAIN
jgi:hypothetical protein